MASGSSTVRSVPGSSHISVPDVLALLDATSREQVYAAVPRDDVLGLLLLTETTRQVLIIERRDGQWSLPEARSRTPWRSRGQRPATTEEPMAIDQLAITQSAAGEPAGAPETAWLAVTGLAASDAELVSVRSEIDFYPAAVSPEGIFLALVRAPWRERPRITVTTKDQRRIAVGP